MEWTSRHCHQSTSRTSPPWRATFPVFGCSWPWTRKPCSRNCSGNATTNLSPTSPPTTPSASSSCRRTPRRRCVWRESGQPTCSPPPISSLSRGATSTSTRTSPLTRFQKCCRYSSPHPGGQPRLPERGRHPQRLLPIHQQASHAHAGSLQERAR